jgi:hypothetical protein
MSPASAAWASRPTAPAVALDLGDDFLVSADSIERRCADLLS